jgi:2-oxo-3-hexenedioate decarboxylase/2-keto-4-pentenoate hydratase
MSRVTQSADALLQQFRGKEKYLLDGDLLPESVDEAYQIQGAYQGGLAAEYGAVAGYKIAYTTAALQQASGISEPVAGVILANNVRRSPAVLDSAHFLQPGIECEVGARLGKDLPASGAPYDRDGVSEAVDAVMTSFEVIDNRRTQGQDTQTQLLTTIASNILNAGVVLGEPVTDWRGIHLAGSRGFMTINGELVGEGMGSDVMGHPLEPLAWLANALAAHGQELKAGMVVITGSIVSPKWLKAGDSATIGIEGLGEATLSVK